VRNGRALFYNARDASAHGDISCASCHLFAGTDNISWDLGNPLGDFQPAPPNQPQSQGFHPMKGPMVTQSLKGISGTEPFHWRGDRTDLAAFNPAFVSLMGRGSQLSASDLQLFQTFVSAVAYPQNPFRNLDDSMPGTLAGGNPTHGESLFNTGNLDGGSVQCAQCHTLPTGENGLIISRQLIREPQDMKVPQLRNMWEKTRFQTTGASVRGFGYDHDGSVKDLFTFLQFPGFSFSSDNDRRDVAAAELHRCSDAQHAANRRIGKALGGRLVVAQHRAGPLDQVAAGFRRHHAPGRAIDQPQPDAFFQGRQCARHRRRRAPELARRADQAALLQDAHEGCQLVQAIHAIIPDLAIMTCQWCLFRRSSAIPTLRREGRRSPC